MRERKGGLNVNGKYRNLRTRGRWNYYEMRQNNEIWNDECKVKVRKSR